MENKKLILGVADVAELLGISDRALRMRVLREKGAPMPIRLGGRLAWREKDILSWLDREAREQGVTYCDPSSAPSKTKRREPGRPRNKAS